MEKEEHVHPHKHEHGHVHTKSPEETLALLNYMLTHNRQHTEELHDLAHHVSEEAEAVLHEAVEDYRRGNEKLARALEKLKEG